jgi:hypothetical protein
MSLETTAVPVLTVVLVTSLVSAAVGYDSGNQRCQSCQSRESGDP